MHGYQDGSDFLRIIAGAGNAQKTQIDFLALYSGTALHYLCNPAFESGAHGNAAAALFPERDGFDEEGCSFCDAPAIDTPQEPSCNRRDLSVSAAAERKERDHEHYWQPRSLREATVHGRTRLTFPGAFVGAS
jgi:hypothetical protein